MITIVAKGNFDHTDRFLQKMSRFDISSILRSAGEAGVAALATATPVDSGLTAASWNYRINVSRRSSSIEWTNSHSDGETSIAILLQYGHGTGTGGYVQGRDYINPAIKPIFDKIASDVWKAVTSA